LEDAFLNARAGQENLTKEDEEEFQQEPPQKTSVYMLIAAETIQPLAICHS
jgi:hypothetical protein